MTSTTFDFNGVILDCDYMIALAIPHESTHSRAKSLRERLYETPQFMLEATLYELATVCSRKFDHAFACRLLMQVQASDIQRLPIHDIEDSIWQEFYGQKKKSTSFFDCANLVAAKHFSMKIASFDRFYPKTILAA